MLDGLIRTALASLLVTAMPAGAQLVPGQIRTIDLPPSESAEPAIAVEPVEAPPAEIVPPDEPNGLVLDLPTVEEARASDDDAPVDAVTLDVEAAARAMAEAEAQQLRAANAEQLDAARRQLDGIEADKRAERDRLARYREAAAAHTATMADYEAQLTAARAARRQWEADVAACRAGRRDRCAPPPAAAN
jgi:hypothetical protein